MPFRAWDAFPLLTFTKSTKLPVREAALRHKLDSRRLTDDLLKSPLAPGGKKQLAAAQQLVREGPYSPPSIGSVPVKSGKIGGKLQKHGKEEEPCKLQGRTFKRAKRLDRRTLSVLQRIRNGIHKHTGRKPRHPERLPQASGLKTLRDRPPSQRISKRTEKRPVSSRERIPGQKDAISEARGETAPSISEHQEQLGGRQRAASASHRPVEILVIDGGLPTLWGKVPTKRRSAMAVREIHVSQGFHIQNVVKHAFKPSAQPFERVCSLTEPWEPWESLQLPNAEAIWACRADNEALLLPSPDRCTKRCEHGNLEEAEARVAALADRTKCGKAVAVNAGKLPLELRRLLQSGGTVESQLRPKTARMYATLRK